MRVSQFLSGRRRTTAAATSRSPSSAADAKGMSTPRRTTSKSPGRAPLKVDVFRQKELVTKEMLKGLKISAVASAVLGDEERVYLGTASGYLVVVDDNGKFPIKTRIGAKAVEQLEYIHDLKILVALCDGRLTYHNPGTLRKINSCKDPGIPNSLAGWNQTAKIGMFCVMRGKPYDLCCSVKRAKKLMIAMWDESKRAYLRDQELTVPDHVLRMEWFGRSEYLGLGFRSRYTILYAPDGKTLDPEVPVEGGAVMMHSVGKDLLVSAAMDVGIFLRTNGHPANRGNVSFGGAPLACAHLGDFLIAVVAGSGAVEVTSLLEHRAVQSIETGAGPETAFVAAGKSRAWVASPDHVAALSFAPVSSQVQQMVRAGHVSAAERLLAKHKPSEAERSEFHRNAGWALVTKLRFDEAFQHFARSRVDPRKVLKFFPELKSKSLLAAADEGKHGIHSIVSKSEDPETNLELARLHLFRYLWHYRQYRSSRLTDRAVKPLKAEYQRLKDGDMLEEAMKVKEEIDKIKALDREKLAAVDTALLVLHVKFARKFKALKDLSEAQQDVLESLPFTSLRELLLPANSCALQECVEYLQKGAESPQETDTALLYQSKRMFAKALEIWHDLSKGERVEKGEDGIQPTIELLSAVNIDGGELDPETFWEHARWVLIASPREGIRVFTSSKRTPPLDPDQVLEFLQGINVMDEKVDLTGIYLKFVAENTENARFHDMYAYQLYSRYKSLVEGKVSDMLIRSARMELRTFLKTGTRFDLQHMLETISKSNLYEEMVILYARLGLHKSVLQTYVHDLKDFNGAEKYCLDTGGVNEGEQVGTSGDNPGPAELLNLLLRIYLKNIDGDAPLDSEQSVQSQYGLYQLLANCSEYLDPIETLKLIPEEMPLDTLSSYLETVMRACVSKRRNAQIVSKLVRAERLQTKLQHLEAKRKYFTIDTKTECAVCHKKIGDSYFSAYPPKTSLFPEQAFKSSHWTIVHKGCSRKFQASMRNDMKSANEIQMLWPNPSQPKVRPRVIPVSVEPKQLKKKHSRKQMVKGYIDALGAAGI
mmetsp:Transcript_4064/g.9554  ORF Transcript_4064/g.9554 Transcript_4064/m.9554 type:complete len:1048 (-) Transcript_4064:234-3377(-)